MLMWLEKNNKTITAMKTLILFLIIPLIFAFSFSLYSQNTEAEKLYNQHCAQCHGKGLQGGMSSSLFDGVWNYGEGTNYIRRNIKFGIPHVGMPKYEETLSDSEISLLVD
jgi:aldose sugar dehydrogenase